MNSLDATYLVVHSCLSGHASCRSWWWSESGLIVAKFLIVRGKLDRTSLR